MLVSAEGNKFTVEITGNILKLTSSGGNERMWQRVGGERSVNEKTIEVDENEADEDEKTNDAPSGASSASSKNTSDWRQFLKDYDTWMTKFIANPTDTKWLGELLEWSEKTIEIQSNLSDEELLEFVEESVRIAGRALE